MVHLVTFGEIMMRLSPPGKKKLHQTDQLDILYAGAEANVSCALAYWGLQASHVTKFPDNALGYAATAAMRKVNVDMSHVQYDPNGRMGLFFLEHGAMYRATSITYDRLPSSFSSMDADCFDWKKILKDVKWFHWTGITPAISQSAADSLLKALKVANEYGITVSADINYRSNLWQYGKQPGEVMHDLVALSHILVAAESDTSTIFGIDAPATDEGFMELTSKMKARFPSIRGMIASRRQADHASKNELAGLYWNGTDLLKSKKYVLDNIVDRIGSGDAMMAGFIYSSLQNASDQEKIDIATASAVMKHTVEGDVNFVSMNEINNLVNGNTGGRVKR
ncbi:MAG: PfkB family carbohydrate kinase [Chitinophagaceae bacterium]